MLLLGWVGRSVRGAITDVIAPPIKKRSPTVTGVKSDIRGLKQTFSSVQLDFEAPRDRLTWTKPQCAAACSRSGLETDETDTSIDHNTPRGVLLSKQVSVSSVSSPGRLHVAAH